MWFYQNWLWNFVGNDWDKSLVQLTILESDGDLVRCASRWIFLFIRDSVIASFVGDKVTRVLAVAASYSSRLLLRSVTLTVVSWRNMRRLAKLGAIRLRRRWLFQLPPLASADPLECSDRWRHLQVKERSKELADCLREVIKIKIESRVTLRRPTPY
jgi:hypothetical protein